MPTVGVDLGGTKCLGMLVADDGSVLAEERRPTPTGSSDAIVDVVVAMAEPLVARGGRAVGLGAPGLVEAETGILRFAPNLPGVVDLDLGSRVSSRLGVPVHVDNDATCAAWAEHRIGAGVGVADMVLVTLGTGIGGGVVSGGRLVRGANGFAGEIGHMVVDPNGPDCGCGQRGCWERYASGSGLGRFAQEAASAGAAARIVELAGEAAAVRGEHVTAAAAEGDLEATAVMQRYAQWLALGLANLAALLDPSMFCLAGGLVEAGEVLLAPTRLAFADLFEGGQHRPPVSIVSATLGERAGAVGAALLAAGRG